MKVLLIHSSGKVILELEAVRVKDEVAYEGRDEYGAFLGG